jgi:ABC-type sugar transport system permease subunit
MAITNSQTTGISPGSVARMRRPNLRTRLARAGTPYLFIAPFFAVFFTFFGYPVGYSFYVSLHSWTGQGPMKWVGWGNYTFALGDNYFIEALQTTGLIWLSVPVMLFIALIVAVIWNRPHMWARNVLMVLYLLPTVISVVAASVVFRIFYDPTAGPIDTALGWFHIAPINWLGDETSARFGLFLVRIWETIGLGVLFFASALQAIPQDYYDAAAVDGSGPINQFFSLTVPLLARTILFLTVWNTLSALSLFAEPALIMNQGGPNFATQTLGLYLYNDVGQLQFGTASAVSFMTTAIMMIISVVLFTIARRWTND